MKRYLYMIILILFACLFSYLFSFCGADRFMFYTFFFFISAFLCGLKPMPVLAVFCVCDRLFFKGDTIHLFMLFVFVVSVCVLYRKLRVYQSLALGILMCFGAGAVLSLCMGIDIYVIFDKWICYLICVAAAPPVVFALRRAGLVNRKKVSF